MTIFVFNRAEITVGKGENTGFLVFSKAFFVRVIKSGDCVVKSQSFTTQPPH